MNYNVDREIKELVCEIVLFILILVITVPICVNASNNYNDRKKEIQNCSDISVLIDNSGMSKFVVINNYDDNKVVVNLVMKISKFSDDYMLVLDNKKLYLDEMDFTEDSSFYYYSLGTYEIDEVLRLEFCLELVGSNLYDEAITYSFLVEAANC